VTDKEREPLLMLDLITLWAFTRPDVFPSRGNSKISDGNGDGIWIENRVVVIYGDGMGGGYGEGRGGNGEGRADA
jgi:hypothetical protein